RNGFEVAAMNRLQGSVVLIAGAASGIGAAIARRCISEGAGCVCADHDFLPATQLAGILGPSAAACQCDVTDIGSARDAVEFARQKFRRLDGVEPHTVPRATDTTRL